MFWSPVFKLEMAWSLLTNPSTAISTKCLMPHSLNISFWVVSSPNAALKVKGLIWPKLLSICKNRRRKKNSCFKSNNKKSRLWNVKTDVSYNKVLLIHGGGICGRVVNTSNSRSGGLGFKPRPLHCILRQGTLLHFVSLHPGVSMGTSDIVTYCWGVTLRWTSILSRMGGEKQRKERSNDQFKAKAHGNFPGPLLLVILLPCCDLI